MHVHTHKQTFRMFFTIVRTDFALPFTLLCIFPYMNLIWEVLDETSSHVK